MEFFTVTSGSHLQTLIPTQTDPTVQTSFI